MSNITVEDMLSEILKIEKSSIKKRQDVIGVHTTKYGRNKADADVVTEILSILDEEGIGNED